ncbi:MAG: hypothetical protein H6713_21010 [Myxococcales bacterium]|nr:hypothetical protein [Myxococcales bacterium]MCB9752442.1 hypothetical protein [Myxococcales bacterium]
MDRFLRTAGACLALGVIGMALGCVIYVEDVEDGDPCAGVTCSADGGCEAGVCFCDEGYSGNPYNDRGCQPTAPAADGSACEPSCGVNAHCSDNACYCDVGHVAVCPGADCLPEDRVCDGEADCPGGEDEAAEVCNRTILQEFLLTDDCYDGLDIQWRLWSEDNSWVWPGPESAFQTAGDGVDTYELVDCYAGEWLFFGGESGAATWGVGLQGELPCENCGFQCGQAPTIDIGYLTCY